MVRSTRSVRLEPRGRLSMIRKSGNRFSEKIMLKNEDNYRLVSRQPAASASSTEQNQRVP